MRPITLSGFADKFAAFGSRASVVAHVGGGTIVTVCGEMLSLVWVLVK